MTKRQRIDSASAAVIVATGMAREIAPPDCEPLDEGDLPYWDAIVRTRAKAEWTEENRIVAAKLARAMADEKRIIMQLREEADIVENARGTPVVNPKHSLVEQIARRVMAWRKALALDARGADGRASDISKRRNQALSIEGSIASVGDDLIARPSNSQQFN